MSKKHPVRRAYKYIMARTLPNKWKLLGDGEKAYARHLVKDYGCPVNIAIQHSYIFGYDKYTYDHRAGRAAIDSATRDDFWKSVPVYETNDMYGNSYYTFDQRGTYVGRFVITTNNCYEYRNTEYGYVLLDKDYGPLRPKRLGNGHFVAVTECGTQVARMRKA